MKNTSRPLAGTILTWSIIVLFSLDAVLLGWTGWRSSPNVTEVGHMGATVYLWRTLRFDVFNVNPPLTRIVSGLPIIMGDPKFDWRRYSNRPQDRVEWALGIDFIDANGLEKSRRFFTLARWSLIPLVLLGGYFGYRLSQDIYGDAAGVVFLALWSFSPLLLGWGATICPDAVAAALGLVALDRFRRWLHEPNWTRAAIAGVCLGLLPLTKLTWAVAFFLWPLIWSVWTAPLRLINSDGRCRPPASQLAAILLLSLYTLNLGYLGDGTGRRLGDYAFLSNLLNGRQVDEYLRLPVAGNRFAGTWLGAIPLPLPADFVQGIDSQRYDFERGAPSYLRGEWSDHGWWYYYLYALVIKEPLGTWFLLALAVVVSLFGRGYSARWRDEVVVLAPPAAILMLVSSQTGFSIHARYVLPALPFLFVWTSKIGRAFQMTPVTRKRRILAGMATLALLVSVGESLAICPHSLSAFNCLAAMLTTPEDASYPKPVVGEDENRDFLSTIGELLTAGPRSGPRHLLGSNVDWGQDLYDLENWYRSHPQARPLNVAYRAAGYPLDWSPGRPATPPPFRPEGKVIDERTDPASFGPLPGWYALGVNDIYGRFREYRYFLYFRPLERIGYSIYIYHITLDQANRVRRDLGLPELSRY